MAIDRDSILRSMFPQDDEEEKGGATPINRDRIMRSMFGDPAEAPEEVLPPEALGEAFPILSDQQLADKSAELGVGIRNPATGLFVRPDGSIEGEGGRKRRGALQSGQSVVEAGLDRLSQRRQPPTTPSGDSNSIEKLVEAEGAAVVVRPSGAMLPLVHPEHGLQGLSAGAKVGIVAADEFNRSGVSLLEALKGPLEVGQRIARSMTERSVRLEQRQLTDSLMRLEVADSALEVLDANLTNTMLSAPLRAMAKVDQVVLKGVAFGFGTALREVEGGQQVTNSLVGMVREALTGEQIRPDATALQIGAAGLIKMASPFFSGSALVEGPIRALAPGGPKESALPFSAYLMVPPLTAREAFSGESPYEHNQRMLHTPMTLSERIERSNPLSIPKTIFFGAWDLFADPTNLLGIGVGKFGRVLSRSGKTLHLTREGVRLGSALERAAMAGDDLIDVLRIGDKAPPGASVETITRTLESLPHELLIDVSAKGLAGTSGAQYSRLKNQVMTAMKLDYGDFLERMQDVARTGEYTTTSTQRIRNELGEVVDTVTNETRHVADAAEEAYAKQFVRHALDRGWVKARFPGITKGKKRGFGIEQPGRVPRTAIKGKVPRAGAFPKLAFPAVMEMHERTILDLGPVFDALLESSTMAKIDATTKPLRDAAYTFGQQVAELVPPGPLAGLPPPAEVLGGAAASVSQHFNRYGRVPYGAVRALTTMRNRFAFLDDVYQKRIEDIAGNLDNSIQAEFVMSLADGGVRAADPSLQKALDDIHADPELMAKLDEAGAYRDALVILTDEFSDIGMTEAEAAAQLFAYRNQLTFDDPVAESVRVQLRGMMDEFLAGEKAAGIDISENLGLNYMPRVPISRRMAKLRLDAKTLVDEQGAATAEKILQDTTRRYARTTGKQRAEFGRTMFLMRDSDGNGIAMNPREVMGKPTTVERLLNQELGQDVGRLVAAQRSTERMSSRLDRLLARSSGQTAEEIRERITGIKAKRKDLRADAGTEINSKTKTLRRLAREERALERQTNAAAGATVRGSSALEDASAARARAAHDPSAAQGTLFNETDAAAAPMTEGLLLSPAGSPENIGAIRTAMDEEKVVLREMLNERNASAEVLRQVDAVNARIDKLPWEQLTFDADLDDAMVRELGQLHHQLDELHATLDGTEGLSEAIVQQRAFLRQGNKTMQEARRTRSLLVTIENIQSKMLTTEDTLQVLSDLEIEGMQELLTGELDTYRRQLSELVQDGATDADMSAIQGRERALADIASAAQEAGMDDRAGLHKTLDSLVDELGKDLTQAKKGGKLRNLILRQEKRMADLEFSMADAITDVLSRVPPNNDELWVRRIGARKKGLPVLGDEVLTKTAQLTAEQMETLGQGKFKVVGHSRLGEDGSHDMLDLGAIEDLDAINKSDLRVWVEGDDGGRVPLRREQLSLAADHGNLRFYSREKLLLDEANDVLGGLFEPNAIRASVNRARQHAYMVSQAEFWQELKDIGIARPVTDFEGVDPLVQRAKTGSKTGTPEGNWVSPDDHGIPGLEGYYLQKSVDRLISDNMPEFKGGRGPGDSLWEIGAAIGKVTDGYNAWWKTTVTAYFPAFHGQNHLSNTWLAYMDIGTAAFNPALHGMSQQLGWMAHQADILGPGLRSAVATEASEARVALRLLREQPIMTDVNGKTWLYGELDDVMKQYDVAGNGIPHGVLDLEAATNADLSRMNAANRIEGKPGEVLRAVKQAVGAPQRGARKMANLVEDHSRRLLFMHNLMKNGGDVLNAAERVKMFLFDYGALTAFERKVLRRFIPFYTFTRKNLALQAEMIVRRPGQFAVQANFIDMVQQLSGEEPATAEELAKTYEHTQRGARVLLSRGRNGQAMWMNSLGNPAQQAVDTITEGGFGFLKQLHPVPKSWFELRSGYRFFSGRNVRDSVRIPDIGRFLAEDTPEGRLMPDDFRKFMHRFVEFRNKGTKSRPDYVSEKPHNAYLVHNLPGFTRLWSEYRKVLSYVQEEDRDFLQPSSLKKGSFTLAGKVVLGLQFSELDRDDADRLDTFFQAEMDYPKDTARERTREMRREGLDTSFEEELANILGPGKQGDPSGRLDIPGAR